MKKPSRDPSTLPQGSAEAIGARLEEVERKIERLRSMYETFFSGVERQPPNAPRRDLNRLMLEMQQVQIRNAALRFRFQSLSQRWTLMTTYWNRTLREIEAGTYRKDVAKVSRRLAQKGVPLTEQEAIALGIPAQRARALVARHAAAQTRRAGTPAGDPTSAPAHDDPPAAGGDLPGGPATSAAPPVSPVLPVLPVPLLPNPVAGAGSSAAPPKGPPPVPRAAARPAGPAVPGMSDEELAALHRRYDEAARTTDRPAPSLAKLKEQLAKHVPALMAQYGGAQGVTFDVTVKDGRVVLRPKPRK